LYNAQNAAACDPDDYVVKIGDLVIAMPKSYELRSLHFRVVLDKRKSAAPCWAAAAPRN
jgi:hypothetical protein